MGRSIVVTGDKTESRTLRSFCRICTAVCGIIVHVAGDNAGGQEGRAQANRPSPVIAPLDD